MKPLSKYVKPEAEELIHSSIKITKAQHEFVSKNRLNLSEIVRDAITSLMKGASK